MRKKIFIAFFLFSLVSKISIAQWYTVTDTASANWLNAYYPSLMNGNQLDTTNVNLVMINSVELDNPNIADVRWVKYFWQIGTFSLKHSQVDSIFCLSTNLLDINLDSNLYLSYIDSFPYQLEIISIRNCNFSTLPSIPQDINSFGVIRTPLTSVPQLPWGLNLLYLEDLSISELPPFNEMLQTLTLINDTNLFCMPYINPFLNNISIQNTPIYCVPNKNNFMTSNPNCCPLPFCSQLNPNSCPIHTGISGIIYSDSISNCILDSNENIYTGIPINLFENNILIQQTVTDNFGSYYFHVTNSDTYSIVVDTVVAPFNIDCPANGVDTAVINAIDSVSLNNNFAIHCSATHDGLVAAIVNDSGSFRPGTKALVRIFAGDIFSFYNVNCTGNLSGTLEITFTGDVTYDGAVAGALVPSIAGNTLTWTIADFTLIDPHHDFHIRFLTDTSAILDSLVCISAVININPSDDNLNNNIQSNCFVITTSYDPNEKDVYPQNLTNQVVPLTYTIHFQNTGTAPAQNIFIIDTLDSDLNLNSFHFLGSSHYCIPQILDGGVLRFNFHDINLPDSNSNEPNSHGWLQYSIQQKDGLNPFSYDIENTASIYFDFNSPVVTNTTHTSFASGVQELPIEKELLIYPNPVTDNVTIEMLRQAQHDIVAIEIIDVLGRKVYSEQTNLKSVICNLKSLSSGVYFIKVQLQNGEIQVKKIVKP